jgi:hypothetical protein
MLFHVMMFWLMTLICILEVTGSNLVRDIDCSGALRFSSNQIPAQFLSFRSARIAQSVQRLATGWTAEGSEIESQWR